MGALDGEPMPGCRKSDDAESGHQSGPTPTDPSPNARHRSDGTGRNEREEDRVFEEGGPPFVTSEPDEFCLETRNHFDNSV